MAVTFGEQLLSITDTRYAASSGADNWRYTNGEGVINGTNYFSDTPSVDDQLLFGLNTQILGVQFDVTTPMDGSPQFVWEYRTVGGWVEFPKVENGDALTKSGEQLVTFSMPSDCSEILDK